MISYPRPSDRAAPNIHKIVVSVDLHSSVTRGPLKFGKSKYDKCVKTETLIIIWIMQYLYNAALRNLWLTWDCCSKAQSCLFAHYEGRPGSGNIASVILNLYEPFVLYIGRAYRYPPDVAFYIFFSTTISIEYFKHAAHSPFFSSKCRLFHNATFFGSCIIHILHTGCAKI